jgi:hypothetical protein
VEAILTTFLAPFLPFLLKQGEQAADAAIDRLGAAAWKRAQALWGALRPKVDDKEAAREAAEDVAAAPEDELARSALQLQLRKLIADDPDLARELAEMLEENRRAGIMADNGAVVVVADRGGVAAGGDINVGHGGIHTGGGRPGES